MISAPSNYLSDLKTQVWEQTVSKCPLQQQQIFLFSYLQRKNQDQNIHVTIFSSVLMWQQWRYSSSICWSKCFEPASVPSSLPQKLKSNYCIKLSTTCMRGAGLLVHSNYPVIQLPPSCVCFFSLSLSRAPNSQVSKHCTACWMLVPIFSTVSFSSFRWMTSTYYITDASWIWGVESEILGMGAQHRNDIWGCRRMETHSGQPQIFNLPEVIKWLCWIGWNRVDASVLCCCSLSWLAKPLVLSSVS